MLLLSIIAKITQQFLLIFRMEYKPIYIAIRITNTDTGEFITHGVRRFKLDLDSEKAKLHKMIDVYINTLNFNNANEKRHYELNFDSYEDPLEMEIPF